MKNKLILLGIFVVAVLLVTALLSVLATLSAQVEPAALDYNPAVLDYGLYWFGAGYTSQKFVPGEPNAYFNPSRPTVIFAHGWQPNISASAPPDFIYDDKDGCSSCNDDIAAAWISAGWNIGIFYWNQFSDEAEGPLDPEDVKLAEAKIWTNDGPRKMRWRQSGSIYQEAPPGTKSAGELFYEAYVAAMTEQDYTGGSIRIAGHSLGNQMAVRVTRLISDGIAAGDVPAKLLPDRVVLLDPYWSLGTKDYLNNQTTGAVVRQYVKELLPAGVLFEWYWSSDLTKPPWGDTNEALKPMMLYAEMYPDVFVTDDMSKHCVSWNLYFWAYALDRPAACAGDACLDMDMLLAKMSDDQLAAVMRSDYAWAQNAGMMTASPGDDVYTSTLRAGAPYTAPYTVTLLVADPFSQTVGWPITLTATVEDSSSGPAGDGTLVSFETDLGAIPPRTTTGGGAAVVRVTSFISGVAHITATARGTGGTVQNTIVVTFTGHSSALPLVMRNHE